MPRGRPTKPPEDTLVPVHVRLHPDDVEALGRIAAREGLASTSDAVRHAIRREDKRGLRRSLPRRARTPAPDRG